MDQDRNAVTRRNMDAFPEAVQKRDKVLVLHQLPQENFELAKDGEDNFTFLGSTLVVRVAAEGWEDPEAHARIAMRARELGIRTAHPIAWGADYSIWERLNGINAWTFGNLDAIDWNPLLDDLLILHANPVGEKREVDWEILDLEEYREVLDHPSIVPRLAEIERYVLRERSEDACETFIHGDAHGGNVIVSTEGEYLALIDWGDADWGPQEVEWAHLEEPAFAAMRRRSEFRFDLGVVMQYRLVRALRLVQAGIWPHHSVIDSIDKCRDFGL